MRPTDRRRHEWRSSPGRSPGNSAPRRPDHWSSTTAAKSPREKPTDDHRPLDQRGRGRPTPHPRTAEIRLEHLRPLILRLHFYAGVVVAPFLLVAALTGLLYAASFQAEKIVYDHELTVPVGDRELPLSEQVAAARKAHPEGTVSAIRPSPEAGATTRVMLSGVAIVSCSFLPASVSRTGNARPGPAVPR
ncbi:hypothetical protein SHIRM173S_09023 [Streptomyces hirsutus]